MVVIHHLLFFIEHLGLKKNDPSVPFGNFNWYSKQKFRSLRPTNLKLPLVKLNEILVFFPQVVKDYTTMENFKLCVSSTNIRCEVINSYSSSFTHREHTFSNVCLWNELSEGIASKVLTDRLYFSFPFSDLYPRLMLDFRDSVIWIKGSVSITDPNARYFG